MEIVWFLVTGAVAGWLAGLVLRGVSFGLIGNVIIGAIGAIVGQYAFRKLGVTIGIDYRIENLIIAFVGAIILVLALSLVKRLK